MYIDGETIIYWAKLIGVVGGVKIVQKMKHLFKVVSATQKGRRSSAAVCGAVVPEGRMICWACENRQGE